MLYILTLVGLAATCFVFDSSAPEQEDDCSGDGNHCGDQDVLEPVAPYEGLIEATEPVLAVGASESDAEIPSWLDVSTSKGDIELADDHQVDEFDELVRVYESQCTDEQNFDTANATTVDINTSVDSGEITVIDPDPVMEGFSEGSDSQQGAPSLADVTTIVGAATDDTLTGVDVQFEAGSGIARLQGSSADLIFGNDGNDTIFIGGNDAAYGGHGCDTFIIDGELEVDNIPIVEDFDSENDIIEISIPSPENELESSFPERPSFEGSVSIVHEDEDTYIKLDGELVCLLRGLHDIDETSVSVRYDHYAGLKTDFDLQYGY